MSRAMVLALHHQSFRPAMESAQNLALKVIDLMYGNEERVKITYSMAIALFILGISMMPGDVGSMAACAN